MSTSTWCFLCVSHSVMRVDLREVILYFTGASYINSRIINWNWGLGRLPHAHDMKFARSRVVCRCYSTGIIGI